MTLHNSCCELFFFAAQSTLQVRSADPKALGYNCYVHTAHTANCKDLSMHDWKTVVHSCGGIQPCGALRSEITWTPKSQVGFGNSFQPAIVASRLDLINCDIAPSAKMHSLTQTPDYTHVTWARPSVPDRVVVKRHVSGHEQRVTAQALNLNWRLTREYLSFRLHPKSSSKGKGAFLQGEHSWPSGDVAVFLSSQLVKTVRARCYCRQAIRWTF